MCKVYNIDFRSLSTVYYYTGQSEIVDDVCNSHEIFLRRCLLVSNSIVKLLVDRRL